MDFLLSGKRNMYSFAILEHLISVSNMPLNSVNHKTLFWFQFAIVTWPKIEVLSTYYPHCRLLEWCLPMRFIRTANNNITTYFLL